MHGMKGGSRKANVESSPCLRHYQLQTINYQLRGWKRFAAFVGLVGSVSGCGGGSGGSQSLQSAAAVQQTPTAIQTVSAATPSVSVVGCSASTFAPNFATETDPSTGQPNQLHHWTTFPARVYFAPGPFLTATRKTQALAGFDWWAQATGGSARYVEVDSATSANIIVQYETRGDTHYGAITEYHTNNRQELLDATITFNMTYLVAVNNITPVAAHEFGHALGIGGHSNDAKDVMSSSSEVYQRTALSLRDVNTLKTAYCGLPDALTSTASGAQTGIAKSTGQTFAVRCDLGVSP